MPTDPKQMKARLVKITPAKAEDLLLKNPANRAVTNSRVSQYARDMAAGKWEINGESIKVDIDGNLKDGQHRLMAVIQSDTTVEMLLITGLAPESQETMDQGRARSFADILKIRGEKHPSVLAGAVKMMFYFERDAIPIPTVGSQVPSSPELIRTFEHNPDLRLSVEIAMLKSNAWVNSQFIAGLHYLFATVDVVDANDFITKLTRGEGLVASDPIWVLRERLISEHMKRDTSLHNRVKLAFIIRTWNAYRNGEEFARLYWTGGSKPDRFPLIDGLAYPDQIKAETA